MNRNRLLDLFVLFYLNIVAPHQKKETSCASHVKEDKEKKIPVNTSKLLSSLDSYWLQSIYY